MTENKLLSRAEFANEIKEFLEEIQEPLVRSAVITWLRKTWGFEYVEPGVSLD